MMAPFLTRGEFISLCGPITKNNVCSLPYASVTSTFFAPLLVLKRMDEWHIRAVVAAALDVGLKGDFWAQLGDRFARRERERERESEREERGSGRNSGR